jgi:hypothetical protein
LGQRRLASERRRYDCYSEHARPTNEAVDVAEIRRLAEELYWRDDVSTLRAAGVPYDELAPWERATYERVAAWEVRRLARFGPRT